VEQPGGAGLASAFVTSVGPDGGNVDQQAKRQARAEKGYDPVDLAEAAVATASYLPVVPDGKIAELPFTLLLWEDFERLIVALAADADGLVEACRYGQRGQAQGGIDIVGFTPAGRDAYVSPPPRTGHRSSTNLPQHGGAILISPWRCGTRPDSMTCCARARSSWRGSSARTPHTGSVSRQASLWKPALTGLRGDGRRGTCVPYPGLAAFEPDQADWCFGRTGVVAQMCERLDSLLTEAGLLVVVGASGSGKSSLLRAGVVAAGRRSARQLHRAQPDVGR
jgi:Novel STAND NTPase 1